MIQAQNLDYNVALPPQSVASATVTSAPVDTQGYHYASLALISAAALAVTPMTALQVQECDVINGVYTPVPATVGGQAYPMPAGSTAAGGYIYALFQLDLRRRKRFLQVTLTNGTTQILSVLALLSRPDQVPVGTTTPANVGVLGVVVNGLILTGTLNKTGTAGCRSRRRHALSSERLPFRADPAHDGLSSASRV